MDTQQSEEKFSPEQSLKLITSMIEKIQDDKFRWLAKKRVGFKAFLAIALLLNATLISIWYFTTGLHSYFWPIWPIIFWTILLIITFCEAYLGTSFLSEEKEYEKLKKSAVIK